MADAGGFDVTMYLNEYGKDPHLAIEVPFSIQKSLAI